MLKNRNTRVTAEEIIALIKETLAEERHVRSENVVIVPTYNEANILKPLVLRILQQGPFDVIIVDDNSPDGTGEVAEQLAEHFPERVSVLHRTGKLGLGSAYVAGFRSALALDYQRIFTMDADFSHDPGSLPALRGALDGAEVVLGSRYVKGGGTRNWPLRRRLLSRSGSVYARLALGLPVHDLTGGFKGFRRQALEALLPELETMHSNGFAFQIETTYLCSRHGFRIVEVPILFEDRVAGKSKMNRRIVVEGLWVVWALRLHKKTARIHREAHETQAQTRLPLGRLMAVFMAFVGLAIILGSLILAPRWSTLLEQAGPRHPVSPSRPRYVLAPHRRAGTASSAALLHPTTLQIRGSDLTPNVPLSIVGAGFLPHEPLQVTIQNHAGRVQAQLAPTIADTTGHFYTTGVVPANLAPGNYLVVVEGMNSHYKAQASFELHWIAPTVQLDTYSVKPKQGFRFAGSGFLSGEQVEISLVAPDHGSAHVLATVRANAMGYISGSTTVPMLSQGNYSLVFMGQQSQTPATVGFNIQPLNPWVVLSTYTPSQNTRLGFNGQDFAPSEQVLVYLNEQPGQSRHADTTGQGDVVARIQTDANGNFSLPAYWQVPAMSGQNTLVFVGQQSGAVATVSFIIEP